MENIEIENILAKKVTGEATSSEIARMEQWRKESDENQALYDEYSVLWDAAGSYEPQNFNPDFESALASHLTLISQEDTTTVKSENIITLRPTVQKSNTRIFTIKRLSSIAAIFVLGIAAIFLLNNNTTITSESGVRFASLQDGSMIWLDEGSSIAFEKGFGSDHRNIKLVGKAFFDVSRNENLPFNIKEDNLNVSVLGTSFTVDGINDAVNVVSGKVEVIANTQKVLLTKNQKVILADGELNKSISEATSANWRNSNLSFDNSPLTQVVADINMFHENRVELEDNSTNSTCLFTSGGMSSESLENIIEILKKSYDMQATTLENGTIKLSVAECN